MREWLDRGQARPVGGGADEFLPPIVEIGDEIPAGENAELGHRILFAADYYNGRLAFEQTEFVPAFRATSWVPVGTASDIKPIYSDSKVAVYDAPMKDAKIFSYPWPARYYEISPPAVQFHGHPAKLHNSQSASESDKTNDHSSNGSR
jgi:hypothetical protein